MRQHEAFEGRALYLIHETGLRRYIWYLERGLLLACLYSRSPENRTANRSMLSAKYPAMPLGAAITWSISRAFVINVTVRGNLCCNAII
jgi:hypothetical protein